jgi:hypothetical protein
VRAFSNSGTEENLPPPRERALFPVLVAKAEYQWQKHNPKYYRQLKKRGELQKALENAAEATILELDQLEAGGLNPDQARELAYQNFLLPPETQQSTSRRKR